MSIVKLILEKKLSLLVVGKLALLAFLTTDLQAAAILRCDVAKSICHARLEDGAAGSPVEVLDEKAHLVARGVIVKRSGAYGVVKFTQVLNPVKRGYPVIIKPGSIGNNLQWTASFSDKD